MEPAPGAAPLALLQAVDEPNCTPRAYVRSDRVELTGVTLWMCRSRWRRRTVGDSKKVKAVRPVHVGLDSGLSAAPPGGGQ